jgi:hypothetical protein
MDSDEVYTPEKIAKVLLDEKLDDSQKRVEFLNLDKGDSSNHTFVYEILITIFMELLFGLIKLENKEQVFTANFYDTKIETYFPTISEKMELLGYLVFLEKNERNEIDPEEFIEMSTNRYCRTIFRYYDDDPFFDRERNLLYHMKINGSCQNKKYKSLRDVFCLLLLEKIYKISFVKV